jgi:hypothetical protein
VTSAAAIAWSVWGGVGTVSPQSGAGTLFTATTPGYGAVMADANFGGMTAQGVARVVVAGQSANCLQMIVLVSPAKAAMKVGELQQFAARVYCNNIDVTAQATITWFVIGGIGVVSAPAGPVTDFTATSAGNGALIAMATLGGVSELGYAIVMVS